MGRFGLTKARSAGGIAGAVERAGGSLERVFRCADLPLRLLDAPEHMILLRDQTRLIDAAAREIGDDALPARLSMEAGCLALGAYADHACAAATLGEAIARANALVDSMLQSSTRQRLVRDGADAVWTYELTDPAVEGRRTNELLALGYRLDMMRRYMGPGWAPVCLTLPGPRPDGLSALEQALGADIRGGAVMAVVFRAKDLETPAIRPIADRAGRAAARLVPDDSRLCDLVEALIALELLERLPRLDDLERRLGLSRRTLQRRLSEAGVSFASLRDGVLERRAKALLAEGGRAVTAVALELGYGDVGHFSRAFRRWTGTPPSVWAEPV